MTASDDHADRDRSAADHHPTQLVDWPLAGRRLLLSAGWLLGTAVLAWVVTSLVAGQWRPGMLGNFVGLALVGVFVVEVWVVGGSALRGMLRAGDEGHRLSGTDVGLLPPQLRPGGSLKPALARAVEERAAREGADGQGRGGKGAGDGQPAGDVADRRADLSGPRG